jgi:Phospholipid-translocating P-type ATPase C-terminal
LAAGAYFGPLQVSKTFFWALVHSIIIFFIAFGLFSGTDASNSNGKVGGLALLQTFVSTMVFLTVNIRILLIHRHRNIFTLIVYTISIVLFIGNLFLFNLGSFFGKDSGLIAMQQPSFFLANIFVVMACIFPEYAIK